MASSVGRGVVLLFVILLAASSRRTVLASLLECPARTGAKSKCAQVAQVFKIHVCQKMCMGGMGGGGVVAV